MYNTKKHKQYQSKAQTNPGSVTSYDTRPGNEVGLFYNAPGTHTGRALQPLFHVQLTEK